MTRIAFLFAAILVSLSLPAVTADKPELPKAVLETIRQLELDCRDNPKDGKPLVTKPDFVESADLNGDGIQDYIFYDDAVTCEMGASFRHGNGGTGILAFAGTKDGAEKAFDLTGFGYKLEKKDNKATAWITVGGGYCGQDDFKSRADAITCDRPLAWDAAKKQFDFAPMKETRFNKN